MDSSELIRFDSMSIAFDDDVRTAEDYCGGSYMFPDDGQLLEQAKAAMGGVGISDQDVKDCLKNEDWDCKGPERKHVVGHLTKYADSFSAPKFNECFRHYCFQDKKVGYFVHGKWSI